MGRPAELRRSVTRADVARYAGVSSAVVSYVVNNGPRPVAPATAARADAIAVLGYRPNLSARALKRGSTQMLGLVVHDSSNPFFASFALEITDEAARRGYVVLVINSRADVEMERRALDDLVGRQIDGVIVASTRPRPSVSVHQSSSVPAVLIDSAAPVPGHPSLGPDSLNAARTVVDHLITVHGHTSIGMVIGNDGSDLDRGRRAGRSPCAPPGFPMDRLPGLPSVVKAATRAASGCWGPQSADGDLRQFRSAGGGPAEGDPRARPGGSEGHRGRLLRRHGRVRVLQPAPHGGAPARSGDGRPGGHPRARRGHAPRRAREVRHGTRRCASPVDVHESRRLYEQPSRCRHRGASGRNVGSPRRTRRAIARHRALGARSGRTDRRGRRGADPRRRCPGRAQCGRRAGSVALLPEHWTGWVGRPGISGSRSGAAWSPKFTTVAVRIAGQPAVGPEEGRLIHLDGPVGGRGRRRR